ncbi:S41 family peptidase [Kordiimonas gwangyangensis]|uniref:S41 family peptidase n=1 Tax=Kordiimonas gwangyangensis TaxID=288022 RepID=UPI00047012BF|nr:S41 family peptidase [Kordiimonas gwangyangensis]
MRFLLCGLAVLAACLPALATDDTSAFAGVWQTRGYGYVMSVEGDTVTLYERTAISCQKSALTAGELVPAPGDSMAFSVSLPGFINATMVVKPGDDAGSLSLHRTDTVTWMKATRLEILPTICTSETPESQAAAIFAQTFREHYPFEGISGLAWDSSEQDSLIAGSELFKVLSGQLMELEDPHVALVAPHLDEAFFGAEQGGRNLSDDDRKAARALVKSKYLGGKARTLAGGRMLFGWLSSELAYLRVDSFYGYGAQDGGADDAAVLHKALDQIVGGLSGAAALVLDMRDNDGGSDKLAIELARRFTDRAYVAYRKQAVGEVGPDRQIIWASQSETMVEPLPEHAAYTGELLILTSGDTVSAAETFLMAMMGRAADTRRLGAATRGSFSDMLPRALPNGWLFALPNERYVDASGKSYDGTGIVPDFAVAEVSPADIKLAATGRLIPSSRSSAPPNASSLS